MHYQHTWSDGTAINLPLGKVVCVGRNYAAHAAELNNPLPSEPLLFIKPATSLVALEQPVKALHPLGAIHYEAEIALLIGERLTHSTEMVTQTVTGLGVALDLTIRDLQTVLKRKGHPWEKAKAFDSSCPISPFVPVTNKKVWTDIAVEFLINRQIVQRGSSADMLTQIPELLRYISLFFTLESGDVVLTGTPDGTGKLVAGQQLSAGIPGYIQVETRTT